MASDSIPAPSASGQDQSPPDIATMRAVVDEFLHPDAAPEALLSAPADLETLTRQLRGHIALLLPEVEQVAKRLPSGSIPRYCLLACAGEARGRLRETPSPRFNGPVGHARRLARSLDALCDHYEHVGH